MIGDGAYGEGDVAGDGGATGNVKGAAKVVPIMERISNKLNIPPAMTIAVGLIETGLQGPAAGASPSGAHHGWFQMQIANAPYAYGRFSKRAPTKEETYDLGIATHAFCEAAAGWRKANPALKNNLSLWAQKVQGVNCGNNPLFCGGSWTKFYSQAKALLSKHGGKGDSAGDDDDDADIESQRAKRGGGDEDKESSSGKIYAPIPGANQISSPYGPRWGRMHNGIDVPCPTGTACIAPADGKIGKFAQDGGFSSGGMVHFVFTEDTGSIKRGTVIGWGHCVDVKVKPGQTVKAGQKLAVSNHPAPHVHFIQRSDSSNLDGTTDPAKLFNALQKGKTSATSGGDDDDTGGGGAGEQGVNPNAAAFAAQLNLGAAFNSAESQALQGEKSLMNDQPLLPFIQQLCESSLREFQSMPNGSFFAFYPDFFGETHHRAPYWYIDDIEILDGKVELTDESLVTHMYVVGDINFQGIDMFNRVLTSGSINVFNVFLADSVLNRPAKKNDKGEAVVPNDSAGMNMTVNKDEAIQFLERYGARPHVEEMPMIHHPQFEMFLAYQKFLLAWSRQFLTPFTFTFMPELFPGGKVGFPDHALQMYIEEVVHEWDYESGFMTQANLSAPAVFKAGSDNEAIQYLPENMASALIDPSKKAVKDKQGDLSKTPARAK
jgi:murein DD-endopeptidase MepM/ murein hydrolase activator NlpD